MTHTRSSYMLLLAFPLMVLGGCASTGDGTSEAIPDWVANPHVDGGLAATQCVAWSGNMSLDRDHAATLARADLAKQIESKAQAVDKVHDNKTTTSDGIVVGGVFERTAKVTAEQNLRMAIPSKVGIIDVADQKQLCTMVTLQPEQTHALFKALIKDSKVQLNAKDEDVLYQEFKATMAQQDLDKTFGNQ